MNPGKEFGVYRLVPINGSHPKPRVHPRSYEAHVLCSPGQPHIFVNCTAVASSVPGIFAARFYMILRFCADGCCAASPCDRCPASCTRKSHRHFPLVYPTHCLQLLARMLRQRWAACCRMNQRCDAAQVFLTTPARILSASRVIQIVSLTPHRRAGLLGVRRCIFCK